ncbi:hypothetical protein JCM10213_002790 [Rhodosporidiobolus nylandii]
MSHVDDAMDHDDSPWMSDDEVDASPATAAASVAPDRISQAEWDKLANRYNDAGYRDGITAGKNARLQNGFDQGFALASPYARELGALRGIAASLLALLTTTGGSAKYAGPVVAVLDARGTGAKEQVVAELREVVNALGKLDANKVLPPDEEAEQHAREHEDEGLSEVMRQRKEMREMEELMGGLGGAKTEQGSGVEECRRRLAEVLKVVGLEDVLSPARY